MIKPGCTVPNMDLPLVGGGRFCLSGEKPAAFAMIVFYRGLHCPVCQSYLRDLNRKLADFENAGVSVVAVSSDSAERASTAKAEWGLDALRLAFDLPIQLARDWGLYVSRGISDKEPAEFVEPGLFLIKPDRTLYAASVQTMPFARPSFADILAAVQFVIKNDYPARGEA